MQTLIKNKGILGVVALFIVAMFIYNLFFKSETIPTVSQLSASNIGNDLLKIHRELEGVVFDQTLFSSNSYLKLTDFSIDIPSQTTGRPNPFNIIGRD